MATILSSMNAGQLDGKEPVRVNNFLLILPRPGAGPTTASGASTDVLQLGIETAPFPKRQIGVIEKGYLNKKRRYAGNPTVEPMSLTFADLTNTDVAKTLYLWHQAVSNSETGKTGMKTSYAVNATLMRLLPNGDDSGGDYVYSPYYRLYGVWISDYDGGEGDMNGEDYVRINATFQMDDWTLAASANASQTWTTSVPSGGISGSPV